MAQGSITPEYVENGKYYQLAMDYSYLISRGDSVALTNADDPYMTDETLASDSLFVEGYSNKTGRVWCLQLFFCQQSYQQKFDHRW